MNLCINDEILNQVGDSGSGQIYTQHTVPSSSPDTVPSSTAHNVPSSTPDTVPSSIPHKVPSSKKKKVQIILCVLNSM